MKTSTDLSCAACGKAIEKFTEFEDRNGIFYHSPGCLKTMEVKEQPRVVTINKEKE